MEASPNIVQDVLPISTFLTDWHTRVTWIGFLTLWVFWGAAWVIRNAFGGDSNTTIQSSAQIAAGYNNGNGDPEAANTANQGHKQLLAAPAWSVNVFVSFFISLSYGLFFFNSFCLFHSRTVLTVLMICSVISFSCYSLYLHSTPLLVHLFVVS